MSLTPEDAASRMGDAMRVEPEVFKHAGYVQVSRELAADAHSFEGVLWEMMDRRLRPWRYPDPNPFPLMDLFPGAGRVLRHVTRLIDRTWFPGRIEDDDEDEW